jgi:uncharacterized caspase-like protein
MRLALLVLILLVAGPAAAADRMVALVFGSDRYATLRPLENATGDAKTVADTLEGLGFEVTLELDRDLRRMRRALDDFREDGKGAAVALIFYAGHGVEISGTNRLLPTDTSVDSLAALEASTLTLDEVRAAATAIAPVALILLDACREDPFAAAGATEGRGGARLPKDIADNVRPGLGRMGEARNTLFAFAAAPGAVASDGSGPNSPFTTALTRYLGTEGLEIRSVLTLVQQEVYDRTGGAQLPYIENGLPAMFFAGTQAGDLPERERLLLAMAGLSPGLRAEIERIASAEGVPLAPLFGALIAGGLGERGLEQRTADLTDAARAYAATRDQLKSLSAEDPEVTRLRDAAEELLSLGALTEARAALDQAIALDKASLGTLKENLVARTASAAASLAAKAGVARTALDYPAAIEALVEAAALHDEIAPLTPDEDIAFARESALGDLGQLYRQTGDITAALATARRQHQAAIDRFAASGTVEAERAISVALERLGDIYVVTGDLDRALQTALEGLEIAQKIAAENPEFKIPRRDLGVSYIKLGDLRLERGEVAAAVDAFRLSLSIARELAQDLPDSEEPLRDQQIAHTRLGDALQASGDIAGAQENYEAGLVIARRLLAAGPTDRERRRDLGISIGKIAEIRIRTKDFTAALEAANEQRAITEALTQEDPLDTRLIRDDIAAMMAVGDAQVGISDFAAALATFRDGVERQRALQDRDAGNTGWLRDLGVLMGRLGDMQAMNFDLDGARLTHQEVLAIYYRLAAIDPTSSSAQRDLIIGHFKLSLVADDPRPQLVAALAIAKALEARGALAPSDAFMLDFLKERIAELAPQ